MQTMNLTGSPQSSNEWSEETTSCLASLNLLFSSYGELCDVAGVPGGKEMYSKLCELVAAVITDGPERLNRMVDAACKRDTAFTQASRGLPRT